MGRIQEIDKEIEKLSQEKEILLKIERLPKIKQDVQRYLSSTYSGQRLLEKHSLTEEGTWEILGEDSNCDLGGSHHQPNLGVYSGTLQKILEVAVQQPNWSSWGGGGNINKINIKTV